MKNINKIIVFFISILFISNTFAFGKSIDVSPYYYIYNNASILSRTEIDEISSIGEMLSLKGVDLIFNVSAENKKDGNQECKDIYYTYLKNIDYSKEKYEKRILVVSYYIDTNEFQFYDDYSIINTKLITDLNTKLLKYSSSNNINDGIIFSYKSIAKDLNKSLNLGIKTIQEISLNDLYKSNSFFTFKNLLLVLIIIVLLLGFRRNKELSV